MKKKSVPVFFVAAIIIISIVVLVVGNIIDKRTPSKKHASEEDLYKLYRSCCRFGGWRICKNLTIFRVRA